MHLGVEHLVARLAQRLGPVHGDVGVAQQLFGRGADPGGDAEAGLGVNQVFPVGAERKRLAEGFEDALGDQLRPGRQRDPVGDDYELIAPQAPQRVGLADHALQSFGHRAEQLVAGPVAERVVDRLEGVEVDEQRRHRFLIQPRPGQRLLDPVEDQGPVRQPGERVVGGEEDQFLLAAREFLAGPLALVLEGLAHPHQGDVEAALDHLPRPHQRLLGQAEVGGALAEHLEGRVAPAQAAFRHLVERRLALGGELGEDPPGLLADLAGDAFALAGHPAGDGHRGGGADVDEAVLNDSRQHPARLRRPADGARHDLIGARTQLLTQPFELICHQGRIGSPSQAL